MVYMYVHVPQWIQYVAITAGDILLIITLSPFQNDLYQVQQHKHSCLHLVDEASWASCEIIKHNTVAVQGNR